MAEIGAPKKKISPYFYAMVIGCMAAMPIVMFMGYMLDLSSGDNGQIQIFELLAHSEDYLNEATVNGFFHSLLSGGVTAKSAILGFLQALSS